jgi:ribulose kinase
MNLTHCVRVMAVVMSVVIGGGTVQAVAAPFQNQTETRTETRTETQTKTQTPDYSKNKTYQQGMREGQSDRTRNLDHSKKRQFKKDDDQKAYESGYQKGRGN